MSVRCHLTCTPQNGDLVNGFPWVLGPQQNRWICTSASHMSRLGLSSSQSNVSKPLRSARTVWFSKLAE